MEEYDLVVIGSGPAGEKGAAKAAYFGYRVALVEKAEQFGGAGVQTGTLPSKTLKETAVYFSRIYEKGLYSMDRDFARETGITDFMYRKNVVTQICGKEVEDNIRRHNIHLYRGTASFIDQHVVKIAGEDEQRIYGKQILIATGSYPFRPADIPFDSNRVHDSDSILGIERFPKSLCVLGAGVIGCEYATIFAAMGISVYIVNNQDEILGFLDEELARALVHQMREKNIEILFSNSVTAFDVPDADDKPLKLQLGGGQVLDVDMFLFAAGRSGNIQSLDCAAAGIETGKRETVLVNEKYQTNVDHIYAVGDVIGFPALASTSMDQGRVAVSYMFNVGDLHKLSQYFPYGIYTVPEVSMVGMTEDAAKDSNIPYCTGKCYYKNIARGMIMGVQDDWFLKIVFHRETKVVLGVHIIGRMATELIHYGMTLVSDGKSVDDVIATVFNFPTHHDLYKYACYDGLGNLAGHKIRT